MTILKDTITGLVFDNTPNANPTITFSCKAGDAVLYFLGSNADTISTGPTHGLSGTVLSPFTLACAVTDHSNNQTVEVWEATALSTVTNCVVTPNHVASKDAEIRIEAFSGIDTATIIEAFATSVNTGVFPNVTTITPNALVLTVASMYTVNGEANTGCTLDASDSVGSGDSSFLCVGRYNSPTAVPESVPPALTSAGSIFGAAITFALKPSLPPAAPTNFMLTSSIDQTSVNLHCDAVPGIAFYRWSRSTTPGGTYSILADTVDPSYVDNTILAHKAYSYEVSLVNSASVEGPKTSYLPFIPIPTGVNGYSAIINNNVEIVINGG